MATTATETTLPRLLATVADAALAVAGCGRACVDLAGSEASPAGPRGGDHTGDQDGGASLGSVCTLAIIHDGHLLGRLRLADPRLDLFTPAIVGRLEHLVSMAGALLAAAMAIDERAGTVQLRGGSERAHRTARLLEVAFSHSPSAIVLADHKGRVLMVNKAFLDLVGGEEADVLGRWDEERFTHPDDRGLGSDLMRELLAGERTSFRVEKRHLHADGSTRWCDVIVAAVPSERAGDGPLALLQISDLTPRRVAQRMLFEHAFHDVVTGLANRTMLLEWLQTALDSPGNGTEPHDRSVAVVAVEIERLDVVIGSLGQQAADALLRAVVVRLRCASDGLGELARAGPKLVALVLADQEPAAVAKRARRVAARYHRVLRHPFEIDGHTVRVSAAVGIAVGMCGSDGGPELLRDAEAALPLARRSIPEGVVMADAHLRRRTKERLDIENGLGLALERNELVLHYQPEVDLRSGRLVGFEALMRWNRPGHGTLRPADFIDVADEVGLLPAFGTWALAGAAAQVRRWLTQRPCLALANLAHRRAGGTGGAAGLSVAVNVAAVQLTSELVGDVAAAVRSIGHPSRLSIEITESQILAASPLVNEVLAEVRALGVRVGLDDFGTSYATLSTLASLELDFLKIDQSFTAGLGCDRARTAVVTATVGLARALGQRVVAEGVETAAQLAILRRLGVDVGQGYLFGRPVAAPALEALLDRAAMGLRVFEAWPSQMPAACANQ